MRGLALRFGPVILALFLASSCAREEAPLSLGYPVWSVGPDTLLSIGGSDEREGYALFDVRSATVLSDGRIAVANRGTAEIRFYTNAGTYVGAVGGKGQGPGEYLTIKEMVPLPGDSLLVLSLRPGLTWLDSLGTYVRGLNVTPMDGVAPCRIAEGGTFLLRDGRLLLKQDDNAGMQGCAVSRDDVHRNTALVTIYDPGSGHSDTLGIFPSTERQGLAFLPHGRSLLTAVSDRHVFVGDTGADSILVFDPGGKALGALPTPFPRAAIPTRGMEKKEETWRGSDGRPVTAALQYPEAYPRLGRLLADEAGLLWVMEYPRVRIARGAWTVALIDGLSYAEPGCTWVILDPERGPVAQATMPDGLFPLEIGEDYVLGLSRDEMNVETLLLYRLERG